MKNDSKASEWPVLLPQTEFPMRGNLPELEPKLLKFWNENSIYQKSLAKNPENVTFTLPDGPPYANGDIHLGHVLNKVLKDIVIKSQSMQGKHAPFIPGWDCHGLPIELKVTKDLGDKRSQYDDAAIRDLCRKEALTWVERQSAQFQRLGIFADWQHPYKTLDASYEANEVRVFAEAHKNGVVYKGEKPVFWCWALQTALADAEVEYADHKSTSLYVKFPVKNLPQWIQEKMPASSELSYAVWTTTPWTLPANVALSVNGGLEYGLYQVQNSEQNSTEVFILATELKAAVEKTTGLTLNEIFLFPGTQLEGVHARHPFVDRESTLVFGEHVTVETGTGVVHTAPGHGVDDYNVGLKYALPVLCPVNEAGLFTKDVPEYEGQHVFKVNPQVVERLKANGTHIFSSQFTHSYPHCWRSKTPLIFRTTPQWFIGIDQEHRPLRKMSLEAIQTISFYPASGQKRFQSMIENRPDWCVSRQRIWGVPIPVFYCIETGQPLVDYDVMMRIADAMENGKGLEEFWTQDVSFFVGDFKPQGEFGSKGFRRGIDILDVWFDSGVCHTAVQETRKGLRNPADLYLEGSDQHRGWFNTSMISSMAKNGKAPFRALVTHGFIVNADGRKLSKSAGNATDPQEFMDQSGAEILRLWTTYEDYGQEITFAKENFTRVSEMYRRVRNTLRFLLGNLADFNFDRDAVLDIASMPPLDQMALHKLSELCKTMTEGYNTYQLNKIYHALNLYVTVDLSSLYLDILKDRLYTGQQTGHARRSSQTVIFHVVDQLLTLMAPILSFTAEEAYGHFVGKTEESIFLRRFKTPPENWTNPSLAQEFIGLYQLRSSVMKSLEEKRNQKVIGASLEAKVKLSVCESDEALLNKYSVDFLKEFFIVSAVEKVSDPSAPETLIEITAAIGEKCPRCWHIAPDLQAHKGVCGKCHKALN